ncbi:hypothetical protein F5X96DRAFT_669972 [Biscogniauxia mediterranea]|nr:hypothetical protein F5X96DRAFT_669972 [Biscogniauxia mediterranea]
MSTPYLASHMHESKQQEVLDSFRAYLADGPRELSERLQMLLTDLIDPNKQGQRPFLDVFRQNITNLIPTLTLRLARWYHSQEDNDTAIKVLKRGLENTDGADDQELMSLEEVNELMNLQLTLDELEKNEETEEQLPT